MPQSHIGKDKTDRVDIESFWPFLAVLAAQFREDTNFDSHPALTHLIANSPNPYNEYHPILNPSGSMPLSPISPSSSSSLSPNPLSGTLPFTFPNGIRAKPVVLGAKLTELVQPETWWPSAVSEAVRYKLQRRIANEGLLLPVYLAICLALVSAMYTTTAIPDWEDEDETLQATGRRRVRLTCGSSPISDFGLVLGSVFVPDKDRLAYWYSSDAGPGPGPGTSGETGEQYRMGQDPEDHYRIYIQTLSGNEWYIDFGMYAFNNCILVDAAPYCSSGIPHHEAVPGIFYGREHEREGAIEALNFKLRKRFSILRNKRVHEIAQWNDQNTDIVNIFVLMNEITGRECTRWDRETMLDFLPDAVQLIHTNVVNREYLKFPKKPRIAPDMDPDEKSMMEYTGEEKERILKRINKWSRRFKKGKNPRNRREQQFRGAFE